MAAEEFRGQPAEKVNIPTWSEENLARAGSFAHRDTDAFGFAYEHGNEFSDTPLSFEEYTEGLAEDLEDIYNLTKIDNRFSPNYISACNLLEKLISRLGSCCVTRAVLEKKGVTFKKPERVTVSVLYRCVSFNFRKCRAALHEGKEKFILDFKLLDLECRLFTLAERLKSTAEKIEQIRDGRISADAMLKQAEVMRTLSGAGTGESAGKMPSPHRKAGSLPILGSVARELVRREKAAKEPRIPGIFDAKPFPPLKKAVPAEAIGKLRSEPGPRIKKPGTEISAGEIQEQAETEKDLKAETEQIQMEVWNRFRAGMSGIKKEDSHPAKTEQKGLLPKHKKKKR